MNWTQETPKQEGFYWFKGKVKNPFGGWDKTETTIVQIDKRRNGLVWIFLWTGIVSDVLLDDLHGQWFGPVEVPN